MRTLTEPLLELESYKQLLDVIEKKRTPVFTTGVVDVQKNHLLYTLHTHTKRPILILTHTEIRAKEILEDMRFFTKNGFYYPAKDILFYSADVHSMEMNRQRFQVVERLIHENCPILVAPAEALLDRYPKKEIFEEFVLHFAVGQSVDLEGTLKKLVRMGYERVDLVESPGQFALRGGIFDIYSLTAEDAVRMELWDDEIDSIRIMDAQSQRSIDTADTITVFPMRELVYGEECGVKAADRIEADYKKALQNMEQKGILESAERLKEYVGENLERLRTEGDFSTVGSFITYFYEDTVSLLSYLSEDTILCIDEPQRVAEHIEALQKEYAESVKSRITQGFLLPAQSNMVFDYMDILRQAEDFETLLLASISQRTPHFRPKEQINFAVRTMPSFQKQVDMFCEELSYLQEQRFSTLILAGSGTRAQRIAGELNQMEIPAVYVENLDKALPRGSIWVARGHLSHGFRYDYIHFAVFSESEIFGQKHEKKKRKRRENGAAIESFSDLHMGDFVVHDNHGIGVFHGLEKISVGGVEKDYMKITYRDNGNLFVPVNQMDMIQKYIGSGGAAPRLNKLGGQDWMKAKIKARTAVKILAEDLVALYAKRAAAEGFPYGEDTIWQKEFEENFPYEETDDQLNAIEDVKKDMESKKVMDRLLCGDVGYGKTEVAIRAAFKAVQDGKQVAYLVPTTILAQQHYNTFVQRMTDYAVQIELLSRFRTPKQQKESIKGLKLGTSDIVIGTHRILSKDVEFHDLGLVIVDEEQRFGVAHKEKLKRLRENVDILTLTATPIPRTLHMSLSGIRDMSILEEPPQERRPVQTYVMENNDEFIREAVSRELARGGQVFYLYNRVESIARETMRVAKLIPKANITFAHGQMSERELEGIMGDFVAGDIDVLVCTTIIETGLDIANANTMIIQDADRMGLSQLYQLRGRVGRSNRTAYAYLMYNRNKALRETAEKRLQTIREFTEFGSGFKVAMRDLEIRGAGNLLGAEQHGHMESVGYDMYCRLLEEEVHNLKGEPVPETFETSVDLNISAYLPEFYVHSQVQRMELYKKIAAIHNQEEYYDMQEELEDRYGDLPKNVQNLLEIALLKAEAHGLGITEIKQKNMQILVLFYPKAALNPEKLTNMIANDQRRYIFAAGDTPSLTVRMKKGENNQVLSLMKSIIFALKE